MGNSRSRRGGRATAQHSSSENGNPGSNQHNVWLIAILMIFVLAVGITTGRKLQLEDQSISPVKSSGQADSSVPGYLADPANHQTHDPLWPQIKEVAQEFLCGCGQCGDMVLADCICDMPHGGIREKAFIRQQIVNGHPVEQIIAMVQEQFGRRISRPEDMELNTRLGNEDS